MWNFCRLTALGINYKDGALSKEEQIAQLRGSKFNEWTIILLGEKSYAVEETPTFFNFIAYMYYCGGTLSGPFYEYQDFIQFIEKRGHYKSIPGTFIPTLTRLATSFSKSISTFILCVSVCGNCRYHWWYLCQRICSHWRVCIKESVILSKTYICDVLQHFYCVMSLKC